MQPKISVIVPIFNVQDYLPQCLDSLQNQTMRDIEVVLIDDGSTDTSGEIAEKYCSDIKFRCIHTENKGLSAARNRGIREAKAPFIMFVDSDDWVDAHFCELPYEAATKNGADLVIFNRCKTTEKGKIKKRSKTRIKSGEVDHERAIDCGGISIWNKLYNKKLFQNIPFPEGHVYEEIAIVHKLIYAAERIECIEEVLYYYRFRKGSITHSLTSEKDRLLMSKQRYSDLLLLGYPQEKAQGRLYGAALRCCGRADGMVYSEAALILEGIQKPIFITKQEKIMLNIWHISKRLYRSVYKIYLCLQMCVG